MNRKLSRHARLLVGIGAGAVLVGMGVTACDSTPAATPSTTAPATSSTTVTSTPSSSSVAPTTTSPVVVGSTVVATTTTVAKPQPVLGRPWQPNQKGYGTVRPSMIDNNGDPTGRVTDVIWQSWGGPTAIATGMSSDPHGGITANATPALVTVEAFDLGDCNGTLMYRAIEWFNPADGQKFDPNSYRNICTGDYVGMH